MKSMGMRGFLFVMFLAVIASSMTVAAAQPDIAVVANNFSTSISTIDLSTSPPTVYGPFLGGQLGVEGELLGVTITPDHHYALVANYSYRRVYRVDIPNPAAPVLAGSVFVGIYPTQIAIAPDGTFAMVAGGRLTRRIAVIDLSTFTVPTKYAVPGSASINGIAISPDNETWVAADKINREVWYGTYSLAAGFTTTGALPVGANAESVAISPDGKTELVPDRMASFVFSITSPGTLVPTEKITGFAYAQSAAFSPDRLHAYVLDVNRGYVATLDITSPGHAALANATAAYVGASGSSGTFLGVECLAVTPDGASLIVGNNGTLNAAMIDTATLQVTTLPIGQVYPVGVATFMPTAVTVSPADVPPAVAASSYSQTFAASGGMGAYTLTLSGTTPSGLSFIDNGDGTATLSGTPTETGQFTFTVTAEDANDHSGSSSYTLNVSCPTIAIDPATLPAGVNGQAYTESLSATTGIPPFTYHLLDGSLPAGLTLSPDGTLSGTFDGGGSTTFTIGVTDANGCSAQQSYSLAVYSVSFYDDGGAAVACVDSTTGAFQWTVLSGTYAGLVYTGTLEVYNGGTMFWSQPGASQYVYIYYDPNSHMAWGYLYDYTPGLYSSLNDSNTLNNPVGCGVTQPAT